MRTETQLMTSRSLSTISTPDHTKRRHDTTQVTWLLLVASCLVVKVSGNLSTGIHYNNGLVRSFPLDSNQRSGVAFHRRSSLLDSIYVRGGSTAVNDEKEDEDDNGNPKDNSGNDNEPLGGTADDNGGNGDDDDGDENAITDSVKKLIKIVAKTNWGSSVLDHRVEITAAPTRDVASIKKSISRQLPGRPPELALQLIYEGRVLDDNEMLVFEIFEDEEDEEDDDEDEDVGPNDDMQTRHLTLDIVPPVDPKFATELAMQLTAESTSDDYLSTSELIEAYFLNQAAMAHNSRLLVDPNVSASSSSESVSPMLRLEMQSQAKKLQELLKSSVDEKVWEKSLQPVESKSLHTGERRGQRYRSGKGGASTNLRQSIQHNLNIDWGTTIRNCLLFLFFGYFGGRNSLSRHLMLWGAPMCFILQARPVKLFFKQAFFVLSDPPGIFLSLLPAPQQALLNFDMEKAYNALYQTEKQKAAEAAKAVSDMEEAEDEKDKADEDVEEASDDEGDAEEEEDDDEEEEDTEDEEDED